MKKGAPTEKNRLIFHGKPLVDKGLQVSIAGTSDTTSGGLGEILHCRKEATVKEILQD